jgi:hypothetical protein
VLNLSSASKTGIVGGGMAEAGMPRTPSPQSR